MKTRLPASVQRYFGYESELKSVLSELNHKSVLLVTGLPGVGKSEFILKISESFLARSALKPLLVELRQTATLRELYAELSQALPASLSKKAGDAGSADLRDRFGDLLAELESKRRWIVVENVHELDSDSLQWLVSAAVRYLRHSRMILSGREDFSLDPLAEREVFRLNLAGLDTDASQALYACFSPQPMPFDGLNNPALIRILGASHDSKAHGRVVSESALEEWLMKGLPPALQSKLRDWMAWGRVSQEVFEKLPAEEKAAAQQLIKGHFLAQSESDVMVSPVLSRILSRQQERKADWKLLIDASQGAEREIYRLKAGETLPEAELQGLARNLVTDARIGTFFEIQDSLRAQGRDIPEMNLLELELAVDLGHFERAEKIAHEWLDAPEQIDDLNVLNLLSSLSYQVRNLEVFTRVAQRQFELAKQSGSPKHRAESAHWQALSKREAHHYQEARKIREEAIRENPEAGPRQLFDLNFHLGIDCYWQSDYLAALEATEKALEAAERAHLVALEQKALHNLSVFASELGRTQQARQWMQQLRQSLTQRSQPSLEISVGIAEAVWQSDDGNHRGALQGLEGLRRITQRFGSQNQQISLELFIAEISLRGGFSARAEAALTRASQLIELRGVSQYHWRHLRLSAELQWLRGNRRECFRRLGTQLEALDKCEDVRERIAAARLIALSADNPKVARQAFELARRLAAGKKDYQVSHGQAAFEMEFSIHAGTMTAPEQLATSEDSSALSRFDSLRTGLTQAWLLWELGRYNDARALALELGSNASATESPLDTAWALALQAMAEIGLGDWNRLIHSLGSLDALRAEYAEPAFGRVEAVFWLAGIAAGLSSTNEVSFFEGAENLRTRYSSLDPAMRGLVDRVFVAMGKALGLRAPERLGPVLIAERPSLAVFERQMKCVSLDGKLVNLAQKPLLLELLKIYLNAPGKKWTKEEIAETVWREEYNPLRHDQLIYVNLGRLKKLIEPRNFEDSIIVNLDFSYALHPSAKVVQL